MLPMPQPTPVCIRDGYPPPLTQSVRAPSMRLIGRCAGWSTRSRAAPVRRRRDGGRSETQREVVLGVPRRHEPRDGH